MGDRLYRLVAAACFFAALYHVAAIAIPAFGAMAYPPTYPLWRHLIFIVVNTIFGALFLQRRTWVIWPYALLVLQIYNGHGVGAWRLWQREDRIDWVSVITVIGATIGLALMIVDRIVLTSAVTGASENRRVE
jgi:hypothetical protein